MCQNVEKFKGYFFKPLYIHTHTQTWHTTITSTILSILLLLPKNNVRLHQMRRNYSCIVCSTKNKSVGFCGHYRIFVYFVSRLIPQSNDESTEPRCYCEKAQCVTAVPSVALITVLRPHRCICTVSFRLHLNDFVFNAHHHVVWSLYIIAIHQQWERWEWGSETVTH